MNAAIELFEKEERLYRDTLCNTMVKPQQTVGFTPFPFGKVSNVSPVSDHQEYVTSV